jgi:ABC-2 type transport system ATP-binding protein
VPAAIEARGVAKRFGATTALVGLDCSIARGVTGLLGANGAGKTTFISLVLGLYQRDGGDLSVLGHDPTTAGPEIRARIGYAPEHHNLPPDVGAADLVRHLAQLHGIPRRAATERASDTLWQVGLGEERFRPIGTMSTGQRQRVKLAAAIAHDPALVLLDEPTDGLDPVQREDMLALIRRIGTEFGIDIVLSSHLLEEVERICDSVIMIADGVTVRQARQAEFSTAMTGLVVVVDDGHDQLAAALVARGCTVERTDDQLVVDGVDAALSVRDVVADMNLALRKMAPRRLTLEDLFLDNTTGR